MVTESKTIRVMRLWNDGMVTPVYTGLSLTNALRWARDHSGCLYIEYERQPAVMLGADWRPRV